MTEFFRFPHTPHLAWLGEGEPRDDKLLAPPEVKALLAGDVVVEEKLDGANLGISWGGNGQIRAQNRGAYLEPPFRGQFSRLNQWLTQHLASFHAELPTDVIVFGEWCAARHSLDYGSLPDWFLVFDVFDRTAQRFWNSSRRDELADILGLVSVPLLKRGRFTIKELEELVYNTSSGFRDGPLEGVVIRQDGPHWCELRAKMVHPKFVQQIEMHWRSRALEWNELDMRQNV
ncbi:MAG: DNA ligase [Haliea sp.]|nr:DNA ligase [Haliea sp.]|tara:strand:+ start:86808 stop:87500 length:693 start_codon:yes stop_codon:yes gene_type:complete